MRLCNILTKGQQRTGDVAKPAKYTNAANPDGGYLWDFNQIQPGWDSYDIDYPLPVRIIADTKDGRSEVLRGRPPLLPLGAACRALAYALRPRSLLLSLSSQCRPHVMPTPRYEYLYQ